MLCLVTVEHLYANQGLRWIAFVVCSLIIGFYNVIITFWHKQEVLVLLDILGTIYIKVVTLELGHGFIPFIYKNMSN